MTEIAYTKTSKFMRDARKDIVLLDSLGLTLEINKIEREHQEPNKPPIFRKEYND